jgi:NAD(P)-dependent dehydrogenase (short-subunit alcohol dehydrogenase family)
MTDQRPVVVVTGASQGIGREIAIAFARAGCDLVLAARGLPGLKETRDLAREHGGAALVVQTDVTSPAQVESMVQAAIAAYRHIDGVVCNSGVAGPTAALWEVTPEQWRQTLRVNVDGVFLCCRAALPPMLERGAGWITVIGSMTGKRPLHGRTPYTTSKLALVGLVRTLAWEAGPHGVRVNLLSPGAVSGPRIDAVIEAQAAALRISAVESQARFTSASPLARLTEPAEVAAAAVFLGSPAAAAITGEDLNVSAGVAMY